MYCKDIFHVFEYHFTTWLCGVSLYGQTIFYLIEPLFLDFQVVLNFSLLHRTQ